MGKTAIILGASGLTGNLLLLKLIEDDRYDSVKIFTRKSLGINNPKVSEFVGDLLKLETFHQDFKADEVYCCIGTTAKQTPDRSAYHRIDYGIPVSATKLCKTNNIQTLLVISSMGANSNSKIFYSRTKGEMEHAVLKENVPNTYILRPSFIGGKRKTKRFGEGAGIVFAKLIQPLMVGGLKKYRMIDAEKIAQAMIYLANTKPDVQVIESNQIEIFGSFEHQDSGTN
ncbi:MAG: NAD(P)H-binding protein [Bacteroidales bacterium]|nr:NAD(P)H-binding protein [Bacteroidales bacterium]